MGIRSSFKSSTMHAWYKKICQKFLDCMSLFCPLQDFIYIFEDNMGKICANFSRIVESNCFFTFNFINKIIKNLWPVQNENFPLARSAACNDILVRNIWHTYDWYIGGTAAMYHLDDWFRKGQRDAIFSKIAFHCFFCFLQIFVPGRVV